MPRLKKHNSTLENKAGRRVKNRRPLVVSSKMKTKPQKKTIRKKKAKSRVKKYSIWLKLAIFLIILGLVCGLVSLGYFVGVRLSTLHTQTPQEITEVTAQVSADTITHNENYAPVHITVGSILNQPITPQIYKNGSWTIPEKNAAHLINSAYPYEPGNIIIYGHNTKQVFGGLKQVKIDTPITIQLANGSKRHYAITKIIEVTPDKIEYLQPTTKETMTIYTCSGFMDSKRLVIRAEPATHQSTQE